MAQPLTPRQKEVLELVRQEMKHGYQPSLREIAERLELSSPSNIHRILGELERKGYIEFKRSRMLAHVPKGKDTPKTPLTVQEAQIYDYVTKLIGQDKSAPSVRQIAEELGDISIGTVYNTLQSLKAKGYLALIEGQSRSIALTTSNRSNLYPIVLQGVPCDSKSFLSPLEGKARTISVPIALVVPSFVEADATAIFALELLDHRALRRFSRGDYIFFNRNVKPKRGSLIALEHLNRIIVRYYWPESHDILLTARDSLADNESKSVHDEAEDIIVTESEIKIIGTAVGAILKNI